MLIPTSLSKQPVIEAAFEMRFSKETQISEIVPWFLFHALGCTKPVISLPPSQIPKNVREEMNNYITQLSVASKSKGTILD